jgi:hypothetical protein
VWGVGIDFVAQRVEGEGYASSDIFCELSSLRGFVDSNCGLWQSVENGIDSVERAYCDGDGNDDYST